MGIRGKWAARREHRFAQSNLSPFLDGELSEKHSARVGAHLAACESCRRDMASLQTTIRALAQMPRAPLPRSFKLSPQAVAGQQRLRRLDVGAATLRTAGVALSLVLALLLASDQLLARGIITLPTANVLDQAEPQAMIAAEGEQPEAFALLEAAGEATPEEPAAAIAEIKPATVIEETPAIEAPPAEHVPAPALPEQTPAPDQEAVLRMAAPDAAAAPLPPALQAPMEPVAAARATLRHALGILSGVTLAVVGGWLWVARKRRL